jgi:hypothetical protein
MWTKRKIAILAAIAASIIVSQLCRSVLPLSLGRSIPIDYRLLEGTIDALGLLRVGLAYLLLSHLFHRPHRGLP